MEIRESYDNFHLKTLSGMGVISLFCYVYTKGATDKLRELSIRWLHMQFPIYEFVARPASFNIMFLPHR